MSKFMGKDAIISWLLSQLALLLAAAVLLAAVASVTFYNDWKKEAEIKSLAINIASEIASVDLHDYSNSTDYSLPLKPYRIYLSPSYIRIERDDGRVHKNISVVEELWVKPYIGLWKNGSNLHNDLYNKYHHYGNISDPIPSKNDVRNYLDGKMDEISKKLAINPFKVDLEKPLHIEKVVIYCNDGNIDVLIVSQEEK